MTLTLAKFAQMASLMAFLLASAGSANGEKILYLGDSLSMGSFGRTLDAQLRDAGHAVFTYVTGGATPYYWLGVYETQRTTIGQWEKTPEGEMRRKTARVPKIETLLAEHRPDVVIVQTGVNLYSTLRSKRAPKKENVREVTMLVRNMGETIRSAGAKCYWVTPPDSHTSRYPRELQHEMLQIMQVTAAPYGPVYNSQEVTRYTDPYPRTDGIHYGPEPARDWGLLVGEDIVAWLTERQGGHAERPLLAEFRARERESIPRAEPVFPPNATPGENATPVAAVVHVPSAPVPPVQAPAFPPPAVPEVAETLPVSLAGEPSEASPAPAPGVFVVRRAGSVGDPSDEVIVDIKLVRKSACPAKTQVDYDKALAIYEWEVINVDSGNYPFNVIRIAHPIYWNGRKMPTANWKIGRTRSLELAVLSRYSRLEQLQTVDDLEMNTDLPVYIAKM